METFMKARHEFRQEEDSNKAYEEYLRTYFAAMAMQGLLSNPELTKTHDEVIAMTSTDAADALITALNAK